MVSATFLESRRTSIQALLSTEDTLELTAMETDDDCTA